MIGPFWVSSTSPYGLLVGDKFCRYHPKSFCIPVQLFAGDIMLGM